VAVVVVVVMAVVAVVMEKEEEEAVNLQDGRRAHDLRESRFRFRKRCLP
jgi:hypothetical protein